MTDYNEKAREWMVSVSGNIGTIKRRESLAALLRETAAEAQKEQAARDLRSELDHMDDENMLLKQRNDARTENAALRAHVAAAEHENVERCADQVALRAQVNALRDAVVWMSGSPDFGPDGQAGEAFRRDVLPLLASTPEQSLAEHDREVVERCAKVAESIAAPKSIGRDHGRHHEAGAQQAAAAIRALAEKK